MRLLTGAQGSMGIVTWASIKCELLPAVHKFYFVTAKTLEALIDFVYRMQRLRLGDELMIVNQAQLAAMLGKESDRIGRLKCDLPPWTAIIGIAGRALFPEDRVAVQQEDINELAQRYGLKLLFGIARVTHQDMRDALLSPCEAPCYKMTYKGACEEIFFLTTLDRSPHFKQIVFNQAADFNYPTSEIGVYIQPQHQGAAQHCEFNLPYDPEKTDESNRLKAFYSEVSQKLIANGAYFARPYGDWADMVYNRDARSTRALRTIKRIFDPNSVMNPGRLCF
jgi:FAD/FMN-containing dehydrogenase